MSWLLTKYAITAAIVVIVSEVAKRSGKVGGLIAALPLVTLLSLIWLHLEQQPQQKIAEMAQYTFWYVLPTLPLFMIFPSLLPRYGFWPSLTAGALVSVACFAGLALLLQRLGIELL